MAKKNQVFAKQFYDYKKVKYIPYEKNIELQNQVEAIRRITKDTYKNLSKTLGFTREINGKRYYYSIGETYSKVIDEATLSIVQGKDSFNIAMNKAISDLAKSGIQTIDWESGYHRRLDTSVRMNIQSAIRDFSISLQRQFGEEYGADGVEISVHDRPAPDHAEIQGHQFSTKKKDGEELSEFDKLQNNKDCYDYQGNFISKNYKNHDRRSIGEYNCYHYVYSVVLGISKPQYTQKQLDKINIANEKGFTLDGKHYTLYEGTQLQRKMELGIRRLRDKELMLKESNTTDKLEVTQLKITRLINKYIELSKKSGLPTKMERLRLR